MKRIIFILFLMLFILLDGCVGRFPREAENHAPPLPSSVSLNAEDAKPHALNDMAMRYIQAQSGEARRAAFDAWQGVLLDADGITAGELSQKEITSLSILGYMMHFNHCFLSSEYLTQSGLTDPLYIYHNAPLPTLYRPGWEDFLKQEPILPPRKRTGMP